MTISYNWLHEYLPETIEPQKLSQILTSIGLEVESMLPYESVKGGLQGIVIGEVITCNQHPNADKLKVTTVNIGDKEQLQIVCGASNVAAGQKVVVATIGTTIYPTNGDPLTMKVAKIRGVESFGMICAEDELGLGESHDGIIVLPDEVIVGTEGANYFGVYTDTIYEIGLTPNRMDAMSHVGVAKDVCAYLVHHFKKEANVKNIFPNNFKADNADNTCKVTVNNTLSCLRYAGVTISNITVTESPVWLKNKLNAIGVRSINNVVDITNFILHETGQPLHAFDCSKIAGNEIIIDNLPSDTAFTTLDDKERKLLATDLIICDGNKNPMCIAGVFGGSHSGVSKSTTSIFLESACFSSSSIRATSMAHGLRTDAATRFEKGVDIANTVQVLKRAALLIKEMAGGNISSQVVDLYPNPKTKTEVSIKYHYLKKLSGKNYHPSAVKNILVALGFEIMKDGIDELCVSVPFSKPDISLPADIVEEIVRIDGLDNIDIPTTITITPSANEKSIKEEIKNKTADFLVGKGFYEIFTNSITNSSYFTEDVLNNTVKMVNNLSTDLDVLRPSMIETGLECIAYNINRKNNNLLLFEYGKTYATQGIGNYTEAEHLAIYITGNQHDGVWNEKSRAFNFYTAKGIAESVLQLHGIQQCKIEETEVAGKYAILHKKNVFATIIDVSKAQLKTFDIKQPVFCIDVNIHAIIQFAQQLKIKYTEVSKFPAVQRDLAIVVDNAIVYKQVEDAIQKVKLPTLQSTRLFDVFESDKLGTNKKSLAINFTFMDEEKTLTDKEIDAMMGKLIFTFEKELQAEIRK